MKKIIILILLMIIIITVTDSFAYAPTGFAGDPMMRGGGMKIVVAPTPRDKAVENRIESAKIQMLRMYAKAMAVQNETTYRRALEEVMKSYKVQIVHILKKTKEDEDENRKIRVSKNYDKMKEYLLSNKDVKIFKNTFANSKVYFYKVNQVLDDGYYLISKGSKTYRLYAPALSLVDNDTVANIFVQKTGVYNYISVLGAKKTIESYTMLAYCYD